MYLNKKQKEWLLTKGDSVAQGVYNLVDECMHKEKNGDYLLPNTEKTYLPIVSVNQSEKTITVYVPKWIREVLNFKKRNIEIELR